MDQPPAAPRGVKALTERQRFALVALVSLMIYFGIGLWTSWLFIEFARPLVSGVTGLLRLSTSIDSTSEGWTIWTGRIIASGDAAMRGQTAGLTIDTADMRNLLRSVPIYLALMTASHPTKPRIGAMLLGLLALELVFVLSVAAEINFLTAVLVTQRANPLVSRATLPDYAVLSPPYSEAAFAFASYTQYAAAMILPIIAPVALWALQERATVAKLMQWRSTPA